jgi:hypothetical protein
VNKSAYLLHINLVTGHSPWANRDLRGAGGWVGGREGNNAVFNLLDLSEIEVRAGRLVNYFETKWQHTFCFHYNSLSITCSLSFSLFFSF